MQRAIFVLLRFVPGPSGYFGGFAWQKARGIDESCFLDVSQAQFRNEAPEHSHGAHWKKFDNAAIDMPSQTIAAAVLPAFLLGTRYAA